VKVLGSGSTARVLHVVQGSTNYASRCPYRPTWNRGYWARWASWKRFGAIGSSRMPVGSAWVGVNAFS